MPSPRLGLLEIRWRVQFGKTTVSTQFLAGVTAYQDELKLTRFGAAPPFTQNRPPPKLYPAVGETANPTELTGAGHLSANDRSKTSRMRALAFPSQNLGGGRNRGGAFRVSPG